MASERDRINRLEVRSREAENALQQLKGYIELLKEKKLGTTDNGEFNEEARQLERENVQLRTEVEQLKAHLIELEIRNGVVQIPVDAQTGVPQPSTSLPAVYQNQPAKPSQEGTATVATTETQVQQATGSTKKKDKTKTKTEKGGQGREKKAAEPALPVDVSRLELRIGKIMKAWKHPDADSLYVEEVDVGEEKPRNVCSGLVMHVPIEEMQERMAIFLCNLKTSKIRGVPSEAMVMCASTPEKVEILDPPPGCKPGDRVYCDGYRGTPDTLLNPKKKVWETVQPDLHTNEEGFACYKGVPFAVEGIEGGCRAATMRGTGIK